MSSMQYRRRILQGLASHKKQTLYARSAQTLTAIFSKFEGTCHEGPLLHLMGMKNWDDLSHFAQEEVDNAFLGAARAKNESPSSQNVLMTVGL